MQKSMVTLARGVLPREFRPVDTVVLAVGEVTGHCHRVSRGQLFINDDSGAQVLFAPCGDVVTHEEHAAIVCPPDVYDIVIVREIDHAEDAVRSICD